PLRHPPSFPTRRSSDLAEDSLFQRKLKMDGLLNDMHYPYSSLRRVRAAHAFLLLGDTGRAALPKLTRLARDVRYSLYARLALVADRKSTRLNSSHQIIS